MTRKEIIQVNIQVILRDTGFVTQSKYDVNLQENFNLYMTSQFYHIIFHLVSSFRAILAY